MLNRFNRHIKTNNPAAKTLLSLGGWDNEYTQAMSLVVNDSDGCDDTVPAGMFEGSTFESGGT